MKKIKLRRNKCNIKWKYRNIKCN